MVVSNIEAARAATYEAERRAEELQRRIDVADEMLARLMDDIGTGPGVANLREQARAVKHELRGIRVPV